MIIYDAISLTFKAKITGTQARSVAIYKDILLVTGNDSLYAFAAYNRSDYTLSYSLKRPDIRSGREQVFVSGDKAFLYGFYGDSVIYVVDLLNPTTAKKISTFPNPVKIEQIDNMVIVASYEYAGFETNTHLTFIDYDTENILKTEVISNTSSMTASTDRLYFVANGADIYKVNPTNMAIDTMWFSNSFYNISYDIPSNYLFYTQTNFISTGSVGYVSNSGVLSQKVSTHISPRSVSFLFAFGVDIEDELPSFYSLYPNPAQNVINVQLKGGVNDAEMELIDMSGKVIKTKHLHDGLSQMNVENVVPGMYFVRIIQGTQTHTEKLSIR